MHLVVAIDGNSEPAILGIEGIGWLRHCHYHQNRPPLGFSEEVHDSSTPELRDKKHAAKALPNVSHTPNAGHRFRRKSSRH